MATNAQILDLEYGRFQLLSERLLDGLVHGSVFEDLMAEPMGPLWRGESLEQKIKDRLGRDYTRYISFFEAINKAIEDLRCQFGIDREGTVSLVLEGRRVLG